jgi:hypothetical protein
MELAVMSRWTRLPYVLVAGIVVSLAGVMLGLWWLPFLAGIAMGAVLTRAQWAMAAGATAGLVSWGVPLVLEQQQFGLGPTMTSLAAIMGLNGAALIPLFLTLIVGALLGLTGAWTGFAVRGFSVRPGSPPTATKQPVEEAAPALAAR